MSNAKRTNNLPVDVEVFPPTVRGCWCAWHSSNSRPHHLTKLPHDEISPIDQINNLPVDVEVFSPTVRNQLVTTHPKGVLLKGEVLGSSNAKRTNNLPVDVDAFPPTMRGSVPCKAVSWVPSERDGLSHFSILRCYLLRQNVLGAKVFEVFLPLSLSATACIGLDNPNTWWIVLSPKGKLFPFQPIFLVKKVCSGKGVPQARIFFTLPLLPFKRFIVYSKSILDGECDL
ncbi:LOW QUALITY PROTEIN: hypothetical protein HID58_025148 [Brassica napus]|uniref:Uncharacterized protein n=1 Tax=Brassica napus TaxID=3708 RepID=A0ABQ8CK89_BRANA|nr:LOW QUALITY PROTEIN: hypothetical protein HID58_025148 [Brassica napus]